MQPTSWRRRGTRWTLAALVSLTVTGLLASGCAETSESSETSANEPATVEQVKGSDLSRITLTKRAVERLALQTAAVHEVTVPAPNGDETRRSAVPYGAVIYDPDGKTWVYTSPEPRSYVRASVTVDFIDGELAVLSDGPPVGTEVVSVAAAELYGAELGVDH